MYSFQENVFSLSEIRASIAEAKLAKLMVLKYFLEFASIILKFGIG